MRAPKNYEKDFWQIIVHHFKLFLALFSMTAAATADIKLSEKEAYSQEQAIEYCRTLGPGYRAMEIGEIYALDTAVPFADRFSYWSKSTITSGNAVIGTGSEGDGGILEELGFSFYPKERNITFSPKWKKIAAICTNDPIPQKRIRHYTKTSQGTLDEDTGLLWHDLDATDKKARYTYDQAKEMCENLSLYGRTWRLPSTEELYGIVDYDYVRPTLDMKFFGPVMHRYYWSTDVLNAQEAYVVGFKLGSVATAPKKDATHARCVSE